MEACGAGTGRPELACWACGGPGADRYTWCRPCIARAARGAARYFPGLTGRQQIPVRLLAMMDDPHDRGDAIRREASRWQRRFKKRLRRATGAGRTSAG